MYFGLQPSVTSTDRAYPGSAPLNDAVEQARQAAIVRDQRMADRIAQEQRAMAMREADAQADQRRRLDMFQRQQSAIDARQLAERQWREQQQQQERQRLQSDPVYRAKVAQAQHELEAFSPENQRRIAQEQARQRELADRDYAIRLRYVDLAERQQDSRDAPRGSYEYRLNKRTDQEYKRRFVEKSSMQISPESGLPESAFVVIDKVTGQPTSFEEARSIAEQSARQTLVNDDGFAPPPTAVAPTPMQAPEPSVAPGQPEQTGGRPNQVAAILSELMQYPDDYQQFLAASPEEQQAFLNDQIGVVP